MRFFKIICLKYYIRATRNFLSNFDANRSSTMNGTTPDFASTVPLVSATPVEPEKPPRIVQRETSMKLALETKVE